MIEAGAPSTEEVATPVRVVRAPPGEVMASPPRGPRSASKVQSEERARYEENPARPRTV